MPAAPEQPETVPAPAEPKKTLTVRGATVLGIGSMIGAGIFALLGEAGAVAGAAVWISFLIGGIVAGLLGYVCAKLGMRFPSSGGLITYLMEGFGEGRLVGVACWLGYMAAIVIVTAMVGVSFGGYATSLFVGEHASGVWDNVFITGLILVMVGVNLVGAKFVANAQSVIVAGVLAVCSRTRARVLRHRRSDGDHDQPPQLRLPLRQPTHRTHLPLLHRHHHPAASMTFTPKVTGAPRMTYEVCRRGLDGSAVLIGVRSGTLAERSTGERGASSRVAFATGGPACTVIERLGLRTARQRFDGPALPSQKFGSALRVWPLGN